jgi:hypothetical protein
MASPSDIITLGLGSFGSIADIITLGYGSEAIVDTPSRRGVIVWVVPARQNHIPPDALPAGPPYQPR